MSISIIEIQVFPYELFQTVEQIRACTVFPPYDSFTTCLKGNVDEKIYEESKNLFEHRLNLPDDDPEKWTSFEDFLRYYNGIFSSVVMIIYLLV